jgi:ABC-type phosphate transport system substrate-binding protein
MRNINSKFLGGAAFALLAAGFAGSAQAQIVPLFAGGATFPEKAYRDIMNCYGNHSGTDTETGLTAPPATCNGATPYRSNVQVLYVGVGSGNGKKALNTHNAGAFTDGPRTPDAVPVPSTSDFGPYFGTGTGATWVRNTTDAGPFFPSVHFIGSDDPMLASDITTYNTNSNGWGAPIQIPAFIGTVAIPFKPANGTWVEKGKKPAGGGNSSLVNFSTNVWCGIFTGAINTWNNPEITADNGGTVLGTGAITVHYRSDSSGTTFLFSNALINQCATSAHPVPATWYGAGTPNPNGAGNSFFINLGALRPANFVGASGSGGVKSAVNATAGSVGYVSVDFVLPVDPAGPKAANLQSWASFSSGGAAVFKAPTAKNGTAILSGATAPKPPSFAANCGTLPQGCATDPLKWGVTIPKPTGAGAYPIGGFTFIHTYTCFANAADVDALVGTSAGSLGFLRWFFGSATDNAGKVKASLTANGFSVVPGGWLSGAKKLLTTDKRTKIGTPGTANTGCSAVAGNGA